MHELTTRLYPMPYYYKKHKYVVTNLEYILFMKSINSD